MSKEYRCYGPPGTGKTSWLSRQVERGAEVYGPHRILVASFTRAAVAELNRRQLPIPEHMVGTLHAICYRGLGNPEICETRKHFQAFSEENPQWSLTEGTRDSLDDGNSSGESTSRGDTYLREYARLRNMLRPRELWSPSLIEFARRWEGYKSETGTMDFTDLIETALNDLENPPGLPDVGFIDEAQDLKPLEFALVRKWGEKFDRFVVVGDDNQCIYSWSGADPANLLTPLPPENIKILKYSYRVPKAVHTLAENIICKIPEPYRQAKEYHPRCDLSNECEEKHCPCDRYIAQGGEVRRIGVSFKNPESLIAVAENFTKKNQSVLFLASCSYMLTPLLSALRTAGLPFANPYRRKRRDWNPLLKVRDQISAGERVRAFLTAFEQWDTSLWTPTNLRLWLELTKGVLHRGGKEKLLNLSGDNLIPVKDLLEIMPLTEVVQAQKEGLTWLQTKLNKQWEHSASYAIRVAEREPENLRGEPLILIGTVHSVKGGEADHVILSPDISPQATRQLMAGNTGRHELLRLFYVAVTRARESLTLAAPSGRMAMPL